MRGEGFLFILLLAMTVATVGIVLTQVMFGLLEVKKRRLQERLGSSPETQYQQSYGSITNDKPTADLTGMLARSESVRAFHAKLARAYPGVVLSRFLLMIVAFTAIARGASMTVIIVWAVRLRVVSAIRAAWTAATRPRPAFRTLSTVRARTAIVTATFRIGRAVTAAVGLWRAALVASGFSGRLGLRLGRTVLRRFELGAIHRH